MEMLKELLTILGGTTIAVAALAWLTRSVVTHWLSNDIERHKAQLYAQNAMEIERLRAEFSRQTLEHEIRFRRTDEKVAERLDEIYRRLFGLYENVSSYIKVMEWSHEAPKDEKLEACSKANREFWDYFLLTRIYVPPTLYKRIRDVAEKLTDITNDFTRGRRREDKGMIDEEEDYWSNSFKSMKEQADPLFTAIVSDVQRRLGVEDSEDMGS